MPAPPTAEIDVCNLALARLGQSPAESIDSPTTQVEDVAARHYAFTRRRLLRAHVFNFAKRYSQLTVVAAAAPPFGSFAGAYLLPNDHIRLLSVGDHTVGDDLPGSWYDIVNGYLYTSEEDSADTVNIAEIFDNTIIGKWDALFVNLMRLELARDMSYAFTLRAKLVSDLDEELRNVRLEAAAVAGQEKPPRRRQISKFVNNRRLGGSFRDPTRHPI